MPLDGTALPETAAPATPRPHQGPTTLARVANVLSTPAKLSAARTVWESALCSQVDPEIFFPEKGQPTRDAKALCTACPVRGTCLEVFGDILEFGVVGGLSGPERRVRRITRKDGAAA
jgi:WhiB family transcriptional regulator, redox-sensing transcriptional regulator